MLVSRSDKQLNQDPSTIMSSLTHNSPLPAPLPIFRSTQTILSAVNHFPKTQIKHHPAFATSLTALTTGHHHSPSSQLHNLIAVGVLLLALVLVLDVYLKSLFRPVSFLALGALDHLGWILWMHTAFVSSDCFRVLEGLGALVAEEVPRNCMGYTFMGSEVTRPLKSHLALVAGVFLLVRMDVLMSIEVILGLEGQLALVAGEVPLV